MTNLKIAIQGITASFHEVAAHKHFGKDITSVECMSFPDLCEALKNNDADYAVMAIENSIAGSILQNYSLVQDYKFNIIGEVYLRIHQCLMALPGTKIEDLKLIESHPIAIRQCAEFLMKIKNAMLVDKEDTAAVAKQISDEKLAGVAAVASKAAAEKFGLEVLAENIETNKQNFTRFLILSKQASTSAKNNKASISFQLSHHPGSLAKVLNILHEKNINLTKIQSVPVIGKPYQYAFHVDVTWENKGNYDEALKAITTFATDIIILGEYEKGDFNTLT
ncbi:MAG: prephenate dehydratase [Bacteroidetes bacterium]|nr:prephenate dehydratase [Bacteroidota bacterium]